METVKDIVKNLLGHIDNNPGREGLQDTPTRYQKFLQEFLTAEGFEMTTFKSEGYDEMVVQTGIPFYSMCEHHLIPFFGYGTVAYIPRDRIVGLSKLARTLDHFSRKLQNQERITVEVADCIAASLNPKGVGVVLSARHLCMEMRGIQKPGIATTTSCVQGLFKTNQATREEFFAINT